MPTPMVGIELEARVEQEERAARPYNTPGAFVYGTGPHNDPRGLMDAIWTRAEAAEIPIESMNGEYDNGQFELTLCFEDAIKACDAFAQDHGARSRPDPDFLPAIPERGGRACTSISALPTRTAKTLSGRRGACRSLPRVASLV